MLKKLFTSTFLYIAGGLFPTLSGLVLLFPYTEHFSTSDYGVLAIYISFTLLVQVLVNYGIDNFIGIYYFEYKEDKVQMKKFIGTMILLLLFISLGFILITAILGEGIFGLVFKNHTISFFPYGFMSVITACCNVFFKTYITLLIYRQKPWRFFWFNFLNFIFTVSISIVGLYLYPHSLIGPMWGRLLSGIAIFLLSLSFYISEYGIEFDEKMLSGLHKFCMPVLTFGLLSWVMAYINNYILKTTSDVGIYDFSMKCIILIEFSQNGLSSAINPKIFQLWKNTGSSESTLEENKFHHLFTLVTILLIAFTIFILPLAIPLVIRNPSYYSSFEFIPYLCTGFAFRALYNVYVNPVYYFKRTDLLPRMFMYTSLIQLALGVLLIQYYGIWGAVWSALLSKPLQVIFLWKESRKIFTFKFNKIKMIVLPVSYVLVIITIYSFLPGNNYWLPGTIQLLVAIALIVVAFKKELKQVSLL